MCLVHNEILKILHFFAEQALELADRDLAVEVGCKGFARLFKLHKILQKIVLLDQELAEY